MSWSHEIKSDMIELQCCSSTTTNYCLFWRCWAALVDQRIACVFSIKSSGFVPLYTLWIAIVGMCRWLHYPTSDKEHPGTRSLILFCGETYAWRAPQGVVLILCWYPGFLPVVDSKVAQPAQILRDGQTAVFWTTWICLSMIEKWKIAAQRTVRRTQKCILCSTILSPFRLNSAPLLLTFHF